MSSGEVFCCPADQSNIFFIYRVLERKSNLCSHCCCSSSFPIFNKFTPIADSALEKEIRKLMQRAGIAVSRVFTMDASRRSRHSNAYFSDIGHVKRIVLFDTLLQENGAKEILAILAHETGHWKKKHMYAAFHYSHPPLAERVARLRNMK